MSNYDVPFHYDSGSISNGFSNFGDTTLSSQPSNTHQPLHSASSFSTTAGTTAAAPQLSARSTSAVMWNYNPYRRRESHETCYRNNAIPMVPDAGALSVSTTQNDVYNHNVARQQTVIEDEFRRQVRVVLSIMYTCVG
jgi:hypothetical protein